MVQNYMFKIKSVFKEFKEFAVRGNVLDMSIGIIIGAAFGKIVTSLVNDILMPPLGLLLGRINFANLFVNLSDRNFASVEEAKRAGVATINYGLFINTVIDFLLVSFTIFMIVRQINRFQRKEDNKKTKNCPYCEMSIPVNAARCPYCTSTL